MKHESDFHTQPTLAFVIDESGIVTDVTEMLAARRRLPRSEIIGKHSTETWPRMARHFCNHTKAFASPGQAFEALERDEESGLWWRARRRVDGTRLHCFVEDATSSIRLDALRGTLATILNAPASTATEPRPGLLPLLRDGHDAHDVALAFGISTPEALGMILRVLL